ncbi:MAG: aspartate--tRNA ligase [Mycobacterium sp.]|nr:aspartate--tRNA ligase [Mycobacterium sp.]
MRPHAISVQSAWWPAASVSDHTSGGIYDPGVNTTHRYRTHTCGELTAENAETTVRLSGWLHNWRDLGGILFVDLRDNYGITQIVARPGSDAYDLLDKASKESVLCIDGHVVMRDPDNANPALPTGEIEVVAEHVEVLSTAAALPFSIYPEEPVGEENRLRYRYFDLRRQRIHHNILLRSQIIASIRRRMVALGFTEFQTPILTSSSPEGARDFLVPSRLHAGKFFALPQAPQQFKQLLMVAGFDRYFQIAPCFRDEDARADRSPGEFYQLDMEMSFVEQDEIFATIEEVLTGLFAEFAPDNPVPAPFPRITYRDAMLRYGTDKPDLRIPLQLRDVSKVFGSSEFRALAGKHVRALVVPNSEDRPRSFADKLESFAVELGAKGLAWVRITGEAEATGGIAKYLSPAEVQQLLTETGAEPGALIFLLAANRSQEADPIMAAVRVEAGKQAGLFDEQPFRFCWVTDFPLYELDEDGNIQFSHNPFSMPQGGLDALNTQDPLAISAWQYDIVCNGLELSSGAIRNHRPDIMYRAFEIAGYSRADVEHQFGGMLQAFRLGAPPHGGIAPGIDRIVMILSGEPNIRETIAFPLNQNAQDLMMGAPSEVSDSQLADVHIKVVRRGPKG